MDGNNRILPSYIKSTFTYPKLHDTIMLNIAICLLPQFNLSKVALTTYEFQILLSACDKMGNNVL